MARSLFYRGNDWMNHEKFGCSSREAVAPTRPAQSNIILSLLEQRKSRQYQFFESQNLVYDNLNDSYRQEDVRPEIGTNRPFFPGSSRPIRINLI